MVMAKRRDGSAPQPPREAACAVDTWHVEQIARRPTELDGEASPLIEEPARVIDGLPPFRIRNPHRLLDLQPRPSVGIGRRDTAHCHAFAFFNFGFVGFGGAIPPSSRRAATISALCCLGWRAKTPMASSRP
jgi:hypothetical protein